MTHDPFRGVVFAAIALAISTVPRSMTMPDTALNALALAVTLLLALGMYEIILSPMMREAAVKASKRVQEVAN